MLENLGLKKILKKQKIVSHIYLLLIVISGWVIFRADNMEYAISYLSRMYLFNLNSFSVTQEMANNIIFAVFTGVVLSCDWRRLYKSGIKKLAKGICDYHKAFIVARLVSYISAMMLFILSVSSVVSNSHNPFIYFRF